MILFGQEGDAQEASQCDNTERKGSWSDGYFV